MDLYQALTNGLNGNGAQPRVRNASRETKKCDSAECHDAPIPMRKAERGAAIELISDENVSILLPGAMSAAGEKSLSNPRPRATIVSVERSRRAASALHRGLSGVRDLRGTLLHGPVLRLVAVVIPIAVVLLTTAPDVSTRQFIAQLTLLSFIWLTTLHLAKGSVRLSPLVVGVWATSMIGAANGAVLVAAISLMLEAFHVTFPEILLLFAGVFVMSFVAELISMRFGRQRRLLLVGVSDSATELVNDLAASPKLRLEWLGAVADERPDASFPIPVVGTMVDLRKIVLSTRPDLIVVADAGQRDLALEQLLPVANAGFRIVGLPEIYEYAFGRVPVRDLPQAWFMSLLHLYQRSHSKLGARIADLVFAMIGLVLVAPIFLLIAFLVRCSGPGAIFFRQIRLGEGGKMFEMIKFRTMVDGAEQQGAAVWAEEQDRRVTRVGRFLRRTRLDELPQLWNVLRGEMSLIGPRPERPEFLEFLEREVPFWTRRVLVKPGITGWAQVQRGYSADAVGAAEKLAYDLYYLKHRSVLLDVAIVAKTALAVVGRSGAR
jgi:exopolysaccharide biosynthesis polyprenyl glycosylphosphotransferase